MFAPVPGERRPKPRARHDGDFYLEETATFEDLAQGVITVTEEGGGRLGYFGETGGEFGETLKTDAGPSISN